MDCSIYDDGVFVVFSLEGSREGGRGEKGFVIICVSTFPERFVDSGIFRSQAFAARAYYYCWIMRIDCGYNRRFLKIQSRRRGIADTVFAVGYVCFGAKLFVMDFEQDANLISVLSICFKEREMKKVFIVGGTGFVGGHIVEALLEAGHKLTLLVRKGGNVESFKGKGIDFAYGGILDVESMVKGCGGSDVFINLVGIIREPPGITFEKINSEGTRNAVEAARICKVGRFIQMSAIGTRDNAASRYHRTKREGELAVINSGLEYVIFQPSVMFGPGDEFINRFKGFYENPFFLPVIGDGKSLMQPVYVKDTGKCFTIAVDKPEAANKIFILAGPKCYNSMELLDAIGAHIGKKRLKVKFPISFMNIVASIMQKTMKNPTLTTDQLIMLQEDNTGDNSEAKEVFGIEFESLESIMPTYITK